MRWLLFGVGAIALGLGCAAAQDSHTEGRPAPELRLDAPGRPAALAADASESITTSQANADKPALPSEATLNRKIIYRAEIDLVVEQFDPLPGQVEELVKRFGGFIARSNLSGMHGARRTGQWTVRIPADQYAAFLAAARQLGEIRSIRSDSQDVTEEFFDVDARIRNKKRQEERLLKLLDDATGKLNEVLAVERELARVREEIEQLEGRMRVLNDLTTLTTVTLTVEEVRGYVPEEAPTYSTRLRRAWERSLDALVATVQALSIAVVALVPWLAVPVVVLVLVVWAIRTRKRKN